jgi:hypothetical protein
MSNARNLSDIVGGNFDIPAGSLDNAVPANGSITTAKLADDAVTSAKIADDAVVAAALATDAVGADALSSSAIASGDLPTGTPVQVVQGQKTTTQTISGSSYTDIVSATITPSSTSNKILITGCVTGMMESGGTCHLRFYRGSTAIGLGTESNSLPKDTMDGLDVAQPADASACATMMWLDSPSTTSATTYYIKGHPVDTGPNLKINRTSNNSNGSHDSQTITTITLMEITG